MKFTKLSQTLIVTLALTTILYSCKKEVPTSSEEPEVTQQLSANPLGDIHMCDERTLDGTTPRGAVLKTKKWVPGTVLKVSLNGGTAAVRAKVIQFARAWETYANIKFNFVTNDKTATIRVGFVNGGSWSYIGTDANSINRRNTTMNFGWFNAGTADSEYSRTVIHEFGHALGMIHEQSHPLVNIPWDKPAVYAYYAGAPNYWTAAQVDNNLFAKYTQDQTNFSAYDKLSIMHYAVDNALTIGDFEVGWNTVLSPTDKAFIATVYPF